MTARHDIHFKGNLRVGGYVYRMLAGKAHNLGLQRSLVDGVCYHASPTLVVDSTLSVERFHQVAWHEILHAVNRHYCNDQLAERDIEQLSQGLLQVAEQMRIRIVP